MRCFRDQTLGTLMTSHVWVGLPHADNLPHADKDGLRFTISNREYLPFAILGIKWSAGGTGI